MKRVYFLLLAFGFLVSSCNNDKGKNEPGKNNREKDDYSNKDREKENDNTDRAKWSASEVRSFNKDCYKEMGDKLNEDQLDPFCSCLLDKFQDKFSTYTDFNNESSEDDGANAAKQCMSDLGIKKDNGNNNNGGGWSRTDQNRFTNDCEAKAEPNVGAARARQYCSCMLQKMERSFSSYAEADRGLTEEEMGKMANDCNENQ